MTPLAPHPGGATPVATERTAARSAPVAAGTLLQEPPHPSLVGYSADVIEACPHGVTVVSRVIQFKSAMGDPLTVGVSLPRIPSLERSLPEIA